MLKHIYDKRRSLIEQSIANSSSKENFEKFPFSKGDCLNILVTRQNIEGFWESSLEILQILGISEKSRGYDLGIL
jgi:hypothetical protein